MYLGNKGGVRKVNKEQDGSITYILSHCISYLYRSVAFHICQHHDLDYVSLITLLTFLFVDYC